jgi:hypothetical protein
MSPRTRERIKRTFLAALLQSDLSNFELEELAKELSFGTISLELSDIISAAMSSLAEVSPTKLHGNASNTLAAQAYNTITSRRLAKNVVADLMRSASPMLSTKTLSDIQSKRTLKEMLNWYFNEVSSEEFSRFILSIAGASGDEYLAGIRKKT